MPALVDLDVEFLRADGDRYAVLPDARGAQGVCFDCPKCGAHKVLVWFSNPIDVAPVGPEHEPKSRWRRVGETAAELTLLPSVHLLSGCRWHGFVRYGEAL